MADSRLTDLTATTVVVSADLLYVVRDVAGTPVSRKITVGELLGSVPTTGVAIGTNPASAGAVRLANNEWIRARNAANDADVDMIKVNANDELALRGAMRIGASTLIVPDAVNIETNVNTGTKIGSLSTQKIAFWGVTPVAQQVLATGIGATVDNVISLLQTIGLCRQS